MTRTCDPNYQPPLIGLSASFGKSRDPQSFGYWNGEKAVHLPWTPAREPVRQALRDIADGKSFSIPANASLDDGDFLVTAAELAQSRSAERRYKGLGLAVA